MKGRCACGDIQYRMKARPMFVHCCHCSSCQQESGSAFVLNAIIEADHVVLDAGQPEIVHTPSKSGKGQKIARCPECHVAVWSHYAGPGDKVCFVRVGSLDESHLLPPDIHIFTRSKLPWIALPEDTPSFDVYYDPAEVWPSESLKRRKAVNW
ncbi:MAG: GFA family protein [Alphaproteobacteria bacterium]|nr:GFA family protein [Alphaproteobacteria bacterium]MBT4543702.1 GFA family protein [Alphaproteobacteria bacterium]MBT7743947.1 GFA family protein [Alphaproteobacteria bacterium]